MNQYFVESLEKNNGVYRAVVFAHNAEMATETVTHLNKSLGFKTHELSFIALELGLAPHLPCKPDFAFGGNFVIVYGLWPTQNKDSHILKVNESSISTPPASKPPTQPAVTTQPPVQQTVIATVTPSAPPDKKEAGLAKYNKERKASQQKPNAK